MKQHGQTRNFLELLKRVATHTGLTLEQVADFYDALTVINESSTEEERPLAQQPKGVQ